MLLRLRDGDRAIPAGRVVQDRAQVLADRAAAEKLKNKKGKLFINPQGLISLDGKDWLCLLI